MVRPSSASAASISSREMPSRNRIASRYGHVDARRRPPPDDRLGVEGDAQAGAGQHVEVVRAVADRDRLSHRDACLRGEALERRGLAGPVDDRADQLAGEPAVDDLEGVRGGVVDTEIGHELVSDWVKPPLTMASL